MNEPRISSKIECTLQKIESYAQKVRETGDLSWLTAIIRVVVRAQTETDTRGRS